MKSLLLCAIFTFAAAQQNIKNPVKDFCRRHLHQTCIIDSKLFIDGGMVYYKDDDSSWDNETMLTQNTALIWEDVRDTNNEEGFPVQYANLSKDSNVPSVSGGVLWPDTVNKCFYLFGGEYETVDAAKGKDSQGVDLWKFDTIYNNWTKTKAHSTQSKIKWPVLGSGTVHENGWGYYFGGYLSNKSTSGWSEWSNTTRSGFRTARAEGTLQYIPASTGGMLVYFGGLETNSTNGQISHSNMSDIHVYDIRDNRWYTQTAGGNIPQSRTGFCAGTIWAGDKTSYNIYIFGGISSKGTGLGDIWVLSIPSFQWFLFTPDPNFEIFPRGKGWSSCNVFQDSQFMVIGGYYVNKTQTECDVNIIGGQHVGFLGQESVEYGFEMTNQDEALAWWHRPMNNVTRYRVPDKLIKVIGGNEKGGALAKSPQSGWGTNSNLAVYFGTTYSATARTTTRELPSATNAPSGSGHRPNVGAIAGGVVGGVVALIAIIAFVLLCLRHRRRTRDAQAQSADNNNPGNGPQMVDKNGNGLECISQMADKHGNGLEHNPRSPNMASLPPRHELYGEWAQPGSYAQQQTYYPPPMGASELDPHAQRMEMSSVRSPANVSEMPNVESPAPVGGHR